MPVLLYAPGVKMAVSTVSHGVIDLTDDLVRGRVTLTENALSSIDITVANHRRKYDGVFTPNDRFFIQMRRVGPYLPILSGYLNKVPKFSIYPRSVNLTGSCTLKRLQYHPWDPGAFESWLLIHNLDQSEDPANEVDAGIKGIVMTLLTQVGQWPADSIHIGRLPANWFTTIGDVFSKVQDRIAVNAAYLGDSATINGKSVSHAGSTSAPPDGPGTGSLPSTSGKVSWFAGPNDPGAWGHMGLTGESGRTPDDPWYCAMRFPYVSTGADGMPHAYLPSAQQSHAMAWWKDRRLLVTNPKNALAVVVRAADWGPLGTLNRVLDISETALSALGARTDDTVNIAFAPEGAALGPYNPQTGQTSTGSAVEQKEAQANQSAGAVNYTIPAGVSDPGAGAFAWGGYTNGSIPQSALGAINAAGTLFLHPSAAAAFLDMQRHAAQDGVNISINQGYRTLAEQQTLYQKYLNGTGNLAAKPGTSNHGWGFALDIEVGSGPGNRVYDWLAAHAHDYGWVHPSWAQPGKSTSEAWHWEWWAGLNIIGTAGEAGSGGTSGLNSTPPSSLLNAYEWQGAPSVESELLEGVRALMNDEPLLTYIVRLMNTSMRSVMAAPNGDLIGWFPDYFGIYGTAGKMSIEDIECQDFTVAWDDLRLITHQFTAGAPTGYGTGSMPGGSVDIYQQIGTSGIASVEFPEIMKALFNIDPGAGFGDPQAIFRRFGARPDFQSMGTITGPQAEFWFALWLFQRNWADQFSTVVPLTWMPEMFPGMLMQLPSQHFQAYVTQVSHSFDYSDGGGFSTDATIIAPSDMRGGGMWQPPSAL